METDIDICRRIVKNHQAERIDNTLIDVQSAHAVLTLHDALSDKNLTKFCSFHIAVKAHVAWKVLAKAKTA